MDKVIVLGGKGTAKVVAEQIYDAQKKGAEIEFLGFAFDDESFGTEINGFPILGKTYNIWEQYREDESVKFHFQMYRQDILPERIKLLHSYGIPEERFFTFIHPSCMIANSAKIGVGSVIMANTVINANAQIGKFCTIQSNVLVGHDAVIGDYNFFAAHSVISNVKMGDRNFVGINACLNNFITIGDDTFVAMGSNVIKDIPTNTKVMGNPAKPFVSKVRPF